MLYGLGCWAGVGAARDLKDLDLGDLFLVFPWLLGVAQKLYNSHATLTLKYAGRAKVSAPSRRIAEKLHLSGMIKWRRMTTKRCRLFDFYLFGLLRPTHFCDS